jgi:hypothetical protein
MILGYIAIIIVLMFVISVLIGLAHLLLSWFLWWFDGRDLIIYEPHKDIKYSGDMESESMGSGDSAKHIV